MKLSSFSVILTFVILMIIGVALAPLIDVGTEPTPRQGKRMTIKYEWPQVSAKVVEQNGNTSMIEAEVNHGRGIVMYLLSQGAWVKVLSPQSLVEEMQEELLQMCSAYDI